MKKLLLTTAILATWAALPATVLAQVQQPPAPALKSTAIFVLATAAGAITNSGTSTVLVPGVLGTFAGAITGFADGTEMHTGPTDPKSANLVEDAQSAYAYLENAHHTSLTVVVGNGQVLTPDVYHMAGALTLPGELILDGNNLPNPIFIIQIGGAFTSGISSRITLRHGATPGNVFWQVGGATVIGANSFFKGTLISYGAMTFNDGVTFEGRGIGRAAGAIITNPNSTFIGPQPIPLPVTLTTFSAARQGHGVLLKWATASEHNSRLFAVERSLTGTSWHTIATLEAAGTSATPHYYSTLDPSAGAGPTYYRLRCLDLDGSFTFSAVQVVSAGATTSPITAFPNPLTGPSLTVSAAQPGSTLLLLDLAGRTIQQQVASGAAPIQLATDQLQPGTYVLKTVSATGAATSIKVSKP